MPKTITLTRPNGLKCEIYVDEINGITRESHWKDTYVEFESGDIYCIETPEQIESLISEAKKEDEPVTNCNQLEKSNETIEFLKNELNKQFSTINDLLKRIDQLKSENIDLLNCKTCKKWEIDFYYFQTHWKKENDKLKLINSDLQYLIDELKYELSSKIKPKTTNLTREEMLKAIDEGKKVKWTKEGSSWSSADPVLNKDTCWEIIE